MCGIVGYVGPRDALPILMGGLRRLEYRGYDSAGVALEHDGDSSGHVVHAHHHAVEDEGESAHDGELFVEFLEASAYLVFFDNSAPVADVQGPYYARNDEVWVMGDNRNNSHDSRVWYGGAGGGVPASHVKGRARLIWLSPGASHQGVDLAADPVAPSPELAAPLATCLAQRPSLAKTTPPDSRAGGQLSPR